LQAIYTIKRPIRMPDKKIEILLIAEWKTPADKRVAFTPDQCRKIQNRYPAIRFSIEASESRCISDHAYEIAGIPVCHHPENADILFGIKEVPPEKLIPGKTYFFFSHTIKEQPHNRKLLRSLLEKKIEMVDYECLLNEKGERTVAFGRFAGIVGAYNAFRLWLEKEEKTKLPAASDCVNMNEMLGKVRPWLHNMKGVKLAVTGSGRVGKGAVEVLEQLGIKRMHAEDFPDYSGNDPVYSLLSSRHYMERKDGLAWDEDRFRNHPEEYEGCFEAYAACSDILISCHYWNPKAPALFSLSDICSRDFRISVISDVTCDIGGSIPTTLRASTIAQPFYDVERKTGAEIPAFSVPPSESVSVCAVDNLPCELPADASSAFGEMLMDEVIPELIGSIRPSIMGATICKNGELMPGFAYLQDYANGKES